MKNTYFTLTEDGSRNVIAVVKAKISVTGIISNTEKVKKLVELAVKEEWIYESVSLVDWDYNESNNQMSFDCVTEDGDEEIRAIDLTITTLYK